MLLCLPRNSLGTKQCILVCFTFSTCPTFVHNKSSRMASAHSLDPSSNVGTQQNTEQDSQHPLTSTEKSSSRDLLPTDRVLGNVEQDNQHRSTLIEKSAPSDQGIVAPNGGLLAWLQVAASFCIFFSTWYVHHLSSWTLSKTNM